MDELGRLIKIGRDVYLEIDSMLSILEDKTSDLVQRNSARRTVKIRDDVLSVVQGLTRHQRVPATHVLVTMINPSQRSKKPYALPVSCIPYTGLTEKATRNHINDVLSEM